MTGASVSTSRKIASTRRFGGFNFSEHHHFIWQDRACAPDQARIINMLLKQSDKKPAGQNANRVKATKSSVSSTGR